MDVGLSGRRAVVLAGTRGLGRAAALALRDEGARVAVCGRSPGREEPGISQLTCDLADPRSLEEFLARAAGLLGGVDVLVTNCGGPPVSKVSELSDADWACAFDEVFLSIVRATRAVLPGMVARGRGSIVCVGSVSAHRPLPGLALSNALRPAVQGYVRTLAGELAGTGVRVNCLHPGPFATARSLEVCAREAESGGASVEDVIARRAGAVPAGRLGEPAEFGRAVAFLAGDSAGFCTGSSFVLDGGLSVAA